MKPYLRYPLGTLAILLANPSHAQAIDGNVAPSPGASNAMDKDGLTGADSSASSTTPQASADGLQEIIVTAQRRSESLQKVPLTVTAVTAKGLEDAGVSQIQDLSTIVAGFIGPGDSGIQAPHVRGIGSQTITPGNESAVSYYIDGIYISSFNPSLLALNDVAQIEVLKGPQGTLFGRNTTGGLISVTTRTPTDKFVMEGEVGYANYQTVSGSVYLAGGVADGVNADIAIQASHQGKGWGTNAFDGSDVHKVPLDFSARSKWVANVGDRTTVTITGDYERNRNVGALALRQIPGTVSPFGLLQVAEDWDVDIDSVPVTYSRAWGASAKIAHDFGFATLNSISGYRYSRRADRGTDYDVTPLPALTVDGASTARQVSQEFQLAGNGTSAFQWQAGVYYYHSRDEASLLSFGFLFPAPLASTLTEARQITNSVSGYAQGTYTILPQTRLTLGGRYTYEKRELTGEQTLGFVDGTFLPGAVAGLPPADQSISAKVFTWRVALDHEVTRDILIYGSVNRGFKSGGFNLSTLDNPAFMPERLTAYEVGVKSELLDRKIRLNASGFYYDYSNIQVTRFGSTGNTLLYNGPSAKVYGVDVDMEVRLTSRLTLSGAAEFLHSEFGRFPNAVLFSQNPASVGGYTQFQGDATGNDLPLAASFSGSVTGVYRLPTTVGDVQFSGTYSYNSGYHTEVDNRLRQPSFGIIGANISYTFPNEHFTVKVFGKNLSNEKVANFLLTNPLATGVALNAPRTYGLTAGFKF